MDIKKICTLCKKEKVLGEYSLKDKKTGRFSGQCRACIADRSRKWYTDNKDKAKAYSEENKVAISKRAKERYGENKEKYAERWAEYYASKKDEINEGKRKRWAENKEDHGKHRSAKRKENVEEARRKEREYKNSDKWRAYACKWQKDRKENNPKYRLHMKISKAISKSIKRGSKGGESWLTFVEYSLDELVTHLRAGVPDGYTWDDYLSGTLHLDHIVPISVHNFNKPQDADFKKAWGLNNLQLLPAFENMSKGAKLEEPFQPSLML